MHLYTEFSLLCSAILVLAASSCVKTFDVADINQKRPGGTNVGFEIGGFHYSPLENQVARYMLYGLLPDNVFVYGRQYTFHIGIDLSSVYREISFSASVSDWETKIYENNDEF